MSNVTMVGGTPDDEFISRAEQAAQIAEDAAAAAAQAAADAQQAAADAQAAVAAQKFADHADAFFLTELPGQVIFFAGPNWVNKILEASDLSNVSTAGAVDGQVLGFDASLNLVPTSVADPALFLALTGGTMTGPIVLPGDPTTTLQAATKAYVDNATGAVAPYDIGIFFEGIPGISEKLIDFVAVRDYGLPELLTGSQGVAAVAATAAYSIDIQKNGMSIGSIDWAIAGTVATFTFAADVSFVAGDVLSLIGPVLPDLSIADIAITLDATL